MSTEPSESLRKPRIQLSLDEIELGDMLREVCRQITWVLDVNLPVEVETEMVVRWDARWIQETIWLLAEGLLPFADPRGQGAIRAAPKNGWVLIEFIISGNPFSSEELSDLVEHCEGRRFAGRHVFRKSLTKNLDTVRAIIEAHRGSVTITSSPATGTVVGLTLPERVE